MPCESETVRTRQLTFFEKCGFLFQLLDSKRSQEVSLLMKVAPFPSGCTTCGGTATSGDPWPLGGTGRLSKDARRFHAPRWRLRSEQAVRASSSLPRGASPSLSRPWCLVLGSHQGRAGLPGRLSPTRVPEGQGATPQASSLPSGPPGADPAAPRLPLARHVEGLEAPPPPRACASRPPRSLPRWRHRT